MIVRFFRNKDYASQFLNGKFFCSPLSFFQAYITDGKTAEFAEKNAPMY